MLLILDNLDLMPFFSFGILPYGVIRAATNHKSVMILKTSDSPFVAIQSTNKLTGAGWPNLDGSVTTSWYNVLLVKIYYIHSRPVPHKDPPKVDLGWTDHVPHGDAPVLAAGDHHPVLEVEAEMEHGLAVVDQGVDHLSRLDVPNPHSAITRPRDYHLVIILKTQNWASVTC